MHVPTTFRDRVKRGNIAKRTFEVNRPTSQRRSVHVQERVTLDAVSFRWRQEPYHDVSFARRYVTQMSIQVTDDVR